jgi:cytochrome P450
MTTPPDPDLPEVEQFDHMSPRLAAHLHEQLAEMRAKCPVAHSERHGGFWVVTRYADVVRVARDWETFSSAHGVSPGTSKMTVPAIPEHIDPPLQKIYKRLINVWFTPNVIAPKADATRRMVTQLIDGFIEAGQCEFMSAFARPFPGRMFFELILGAPLDEVAHVNELVMTATDPTNPEAKAAWPSLVGWIKTFLARRRAEPRCNDVVDAVLHAKIQGRAITEEEVVGIVQLLLLGGLDTTAGTLGATMIRLCQDPALFARLRAEPHRIPDAVEEMLRLEAPFIAIGRTAMTDTELGGQQIKAGDKVLIYWTSANRDPAEFPEPDRFDLDRQNNRHLSFGAGTHTCAGLSLARMNLRIALEELVQRLDHLALQPGAEPIKFHSALTRFPLSVPITFTPRTSAP